ncbi:MAG TPA: succinate dehydrogenase, hydrophobic membrane anchor protein [Candidatus Azoamicus sp.]
MIILSNSGMKSGLREWILQRFTGIYIGLYFLFLFFILKLNGEINYSVFLNLFSCFYFKVFTILFVFSLVLHSSIGIGIIVTDYIKGTFFRVVLDFLINFILLSYVFFIMQILWGF